MGKKYPRSRNVASKNVRDIEQGRSVIIWKPLEVLMKSSKPSWGYVVDEHDPKLWLPVPEQLILLFKAEEYIYESSYASIARWLGEMTGRNISPASLKRVITSGRMHDYYDLKRIASKTKKKTKKVIISKDVEPPEPSTKRTATLIQRLEGKTPEEKKLILAELDAERAKAVSTTKRRQADKLKRASEPEAPVEEQADDTPNDDSDSNTKEDTTGIIWRPNPGPQTEFLQSDVNELFFGGSRGGSKSEALVADPLRYCGNKNFRGLLIRKRLKDLREIISRAKTLYPQAYEGTRFLKQESMFLFPSGATLEFGYAENDADIEQYQGQEYAWIGIDELPQFKDPEVYTLLRGSCRTTDPQLLSLGLPVMRMTGNPGNVGSPWVKIMFIDPAPAGVVFNVKSSFIDPRDGSKKEVSLTRQFIQSSVFDTPQLLQDDSYLATLASLPEHKKAAWLYGQWGVVDGAAFPEFDKEVHVIEPFEVPSHWPKIRATDWGYSTPFCTLWLAFDGDDTAYVYREYYGQGTLADDFARRICDLEATDSNMVDAVIDGSTNSKRGEIGPSIYEMIENELATRGHLGNRFADRSPGSREAGKQEVHKRLAVRATGGKTEEGEPVKEPALLIFNTCVNLIRTLPMLLPEDNNPETVSKKNSEDHAYDALHYGLRSRPITALDLVNQQQFAQDHAPKMVDAIFGY